MVDENAVPPSPQLLAATPLAPSSDLFSLGMEDWTHSPPCSLEATPLTRKRRVEQRDGGTGPSSLPQVKSKRLSLSKNSSHRWVFLDECTEGALTKKSEKHGCKHEVGALELFGVEEVSECAV